MVTTVPNLTFTMIICFLHVVHLIVKQVLEAIDKIEWPEELKRTMKHYSSMSTLANVWRSTGVAKDIKSEAANHGNLVSKLFNIIRGRPLKGGWGSIDSIEALIVRAVDHLYVISNVLERLLERSRRQRERDAKRNAGAGADEDQKFKEEQHNYRQNALDAVRSMPFLATTIISLVAKSTLMKFLKWSQKRVKEHNASVNKGKNPKDASIWDPRRCPNLFAPKLKLCSLISANYLSNQQ